MTQTHLRLKPTSGDSPAVRPYRRWRVLVVDDDQEIHAVTQLILAKLVFKQRAIELIHARSGEEAKRLLKEQDDLAVVLLDVVMETDDAGLKLVEFIRTALENNALRIILRTGQPGQAPEQRVILDYDINDYKAKSELTAQKLVTSVVASLRSYDSISSMQRMRRGLERIIDSTSTLFQVHSLKVFASGVLTQLATLLDCQPRGVLCAQFDPLVLEAGDPPLPSWRTLATTGCYSEWENWDDHTRRARYPAMVQLVYRALRERATVHDIECSVLYFDRLDTHAVVVLAHGGLGAADEADQRLVALFINNVSLAFENALTYEKMVTAEQAATTDFLTGLHNRRQLLHLGVALLAHANRADTSLVLAMIDIDRFKEINDQYGHHIGDIVLQHVAELMKTRFRASDIVARFGGEEFCVIASGVSDGQATELFDGFREQLSREPVQCGEHTLHVTASIGVTTQRGHDFDQMVARADTLLYEAKRLGRNRVVAD
ncbi:diguanylate cyclase [Chitinibacteraceae bacterium HSL-7]